MCIIIDNDVVHRVVIVKDDPDFGALQASLFGVKTPTVRMVYGGTRLAAEYGGSNTLVRVLRTLDQAGRARKVPDEAVDAEEQAIAASGLCQSNDHHIIALARVGEVRLLCTGDNALASDFGNSDLIDEPRGKVYRGPAHRHLLVRFCK